MFRLTSLSMTLHADEKKIFTWKMSVGVALAMIGFGMYTQTKVLKMQLQTTTSTTSHLPSLPDQFPYSKLDSGQGLVKSLHSTQQESAVA